MVHTGKGNSDAVDIHWNTVGTKHITVTVDNGLGPQTDTHTIVLSSWYVNAAAGNDSNDCLSPGTACQTIGGAMGKASDGDTITIAAGTYTENLSVSKSLSFIGAGRDQTIVDGGASDSVFYLNTHTDITLSGMTIQHGNGRGGSGAGGGMYVDGALTLSQVRIFSNTGSQGSAIFISSSGVVMGSNTTINQNVTSYSVGTIFVDGGKLWLESSAIINNNSESIHNQSGGTVDIFNSAISGTWTHALLRASPAIDAGSPTTCPATDQRGVARPQDGDGDGTATCDIGAFESPFVAWMVHLPVVLKNF